DEAASELHALTQRLAQQERALAMRENDLDSAERRLQVRQDQLDQLRRETTALHVRHQVQQQTWESERERIVAEARRLGEVARFQLEALGDVRQKWNRKRRHETDAIGAERATLEMLRQELADVRQQLAAQTQELEDRR